MQQSTPKAVVSVSNIVCSFDLQCKLDLPFLSKVARHVHYYPSKMNCIVMRLRNPTPITFVIFGSGKLVITGAKSELSARLASRSVARYIQLLGHPAVTYSNFNIYSFHVLYDSTIPLSLTEFKAVVGQSKVTIAESPLCAIYQYSQTVSAMVFESGKIIVRGHNRVSVLEAVKSIYPLLLRSRRNHVL